MWRPSGPCQRSEVGGGYRVSRKGFPVFHEPSARFKMLGYTKPNPARQKAVFSEAVLLSATPNGLILQQAHHADQLPPAGNGESSRAWPSE